ncbi:MAG: sugar kinase [Gemmatimonadota bacterium]
MKRVVTFGEVLLRLSPPGDERLFQSPALRLYWGGAEANVAAGLAALGTSTTHVTVLPDNSVGDAARRALQAEGVNTQYALRAAGRMGLYFLESGADVRPLSVVYDRAGSAFAGIRGDEFDWTEALRGASWFHVSGVSAALGEGPVRAIHHAMDTAHAAGIPVSLDLNYRPALWAGRDPRSVMEPLAARAALLIANPGAISTMLGITTAGDMPEPAAALADTARLLRTRFGVARVAITQRILVSASVHGWMAHLWDAATDVLHSAPRYDVTLVDRVGGGDAFAAALLHALVHDEPLEHAVRFATAAGALKLTIPGDFNRASSADVQRLLAATP